MKYWKEKRTSGFGGSKNIPGLYPICGILINKGVKKRNFGQQGKLRLLMCPL